MKDIKPIEKKPEEKEDILGDALERMYLKGLEHALQICIDSLTPEMEMNGNLLTAIKKIKFLQKA